MTYNDLLTYLENFLNKLEEKYNLIDEKRNILYKYSRELISINRKIVGCLYSKDIEKAKEYFKDIFKLLRVSEKIINEYDMKYIFERILRDIYKEIAESLFLYIYLSGDTSLLDKVDMFEQSIIIDAFFEFLGEVRRIFIDDVIRGDIKSSISHLNFMDKAFNILYSKYFPNYFIKDYKRHIDILRSQVERSKDDFIYLKFSRGV